MRCDQQVTSALCTVKNNVGPTTNRLYVHKNHIGSFFCAYVYTYDMRLCPVTNYTYVPHISREWDMQHSVSMGLAFCKQGLISIFFLESTRRLTHSLCPTNNPNAPTHSTHTNETCMFYLCHQAPHGRGRLENPHYHQPGC